jgi:cytochrome c553
MKIRFTLLSLLAVAFIALTAFVSQPPVMLDSNPEGTEFVIAEDVNAILDNKCFGCHNVESKNEKGKKKLMIDQLSELSKAKLVAALGNISETVENGDMPPQKFLDNYPDKALTEEEAQAIKEWADNAADDLLK